MSVKDEGLKETLEYVVGVAKDEFNTVEIDGKVYTNQPMELLVEREKKDLKVAPLKITSLNGFIDYVKKNRDGLVLQNTFIQITGPASVKLLSTPNKDKERETYVECAAELPEINRSGYWYDTEAFMILLQAAFVQTEDRDTLLKWVGNIKTDESVQSSDDGISQQVVAKTGVATVSNIILPNPVKLRPYRTFQELVQPESEFVFRVRKGGGCALFDADGGAWKVEARDAVKTALQEALDDVEGVVIIG